MGASAVLWAFAFAQPLFERGGGQRRVLRRAGQHERRHRPVRLRACPGPADAAPAGRARCALIGARRGGCPPRLRRRAVAAIALQMLKSGAAGPGAVLIGVAFASGRGGLALRAARPRSRRSPCSPRAGCLPVAFLFFSPVSALRARRRRARARRRSIQRRRWSWSCSTSSPSHADGPRRPIDAARYPNFAALARDSNWYRNATTIDELTDAVPALLTGRDRGLPAADRDRLPRNLFTLLGGAIDTQRDEPTTDLCPSGLPGPGASARRPAPVAGQDIDRRAPQLLPSALRSTCPR